MTQLFADTVFFLALLSRNDQHHGDAVAWRDRIDDSVTIVTTRWVVAEVLNGASAIKRRARAVGLVLNVLEGGLVEIVNDDALFESGIALYRRHADKEWSLTDCMSFEVMRRKGLTQALTADHHFTQAGFKVLFR